MIASSGTGCPPGAASPGEVSAALPGVRAGVAGPVDLHRDLERLSSLGERRAQVVELRFAGGLSIPEVAESLGLGATTENREWTPAKAELNP